MMAYGTNFGDWESAHKAGDFEQGLTPNAGFAERITEAGKQDAQGDAAVRDRVG